MTHRTQPPAVNQSAAALDLPLPRQRNTKDGLIVVVCDTSELEFFVDTKPGYDPSALFDLLLHLHNWGLEPLDDDIDDGPEKLADGVLRTWFSPTDDRVDLFEESRRTTAWIAELEARMEESPCKMLR